MTPYSKQCLLYFLNHYEARIKGPVADYGGAGKWGKEVKAILKAGGVTGHTVLDYSVGIDLEKPYKGRKFNTGICMDLLEHTKNPFKVGETITKSLNRGALLFVTVPFIWVPHDYPKDYFRFTTDGIKAVFPKLHCREAHYGRDLEYPIPAKLPEHIDMHWSTRIIAVFDKL